MIRLSANLSRKVPMPGIQFSSQQYGASLEIEVSDADKPEAIQARIREMYALLSASIDEQLAQAQGSGDAQPPTTANQTRAPRIPAPSNGHNGHGNGQVGTRRGKTVPATQAQVRAIKSIAGEQGLDLAAILAPYGVTEPEALTIRAASGLIDSLKARKGNGARR